MLVRLSVRPSVHSARHQITYFQDNSGDSEAHFDLFWPILGHFMEFGGPLGSIQGVWRPIGPIQRGLEAHIGLFRSILGHFRRLEDL